MIRFGPFKQDKSGKRSGIFLEMQHKKANIVFAKDGVEIKFDYEIVKSLIEKADEFQRINR